MYEDMKHCTNIIVIVCLATLDETKDVYLNPGGLLSVQTTLNTHSRLMAEISAAPHLKEIMKNLVHTYN